MQAIGQWAGDRRGQAWNVTSRHGERVNSGNAAHGIKATGRRYNDGVRHISLFAVHGMRNTPDLANQVHILGSEIGTCPANTHLQASVGFYCVSDLFRLQDDIEAMF